MTEDTGSSCSGQIAVFGGTSCTVNNVPNNSGSVSLTQGEHESLIRIVLFVLLSVLFIIGLKYLHSKCTKHYIRQGQRRSETLPTIQPPRRTKIVYVKAPEVVEKSPTPDIEIC